MKMYEWIMKIFSCYSIFITVDFFICEGRLFTTIFYGQRFSLMRVSFRVIFVFGSFLGGFGLITISYRCVPFPIWLAQYLVLWCSWNTLKNGSFHQCLQFFIRRPGISHAKGANFIVRAGCTWKIRNILIPQEEPFGIPVQLWHFFVPIFIGQVCVCISGPRLGAINFCLVLQQLYFFITSILSEASSIFLFAFQH